MLLTHHVLAPPVGSTVAFPKPSKHPNVRCNGTVRGVKDPLCLCEHSLAGTRSLRRRQSGASDVSAWAACFGLAVLLGVIGLAAFSLRYYGAWQGRYLYVCVAPIALLLSEGGARWLPRQRSALAIALLGAALAALDAALLWKLDAFFDETARTLWGLRTSL